MDLEALLHNSKTHNNLIISNNNNNNNNKYKISKKNTKTKLILTTEMIVFLYLKHKIKQPNKKPQNKVWLLKVFLINMNNNFKP